MRIMTIQNNKSTTMTPKRQRCHQYRAVTSIAPIMMVVILFVLSSIMIPTSMSVTVVHATSTTTTTEVGRLRGQNQRQLQVARQHQRRHPMPMQMEEEEEQQQQGRRRMQQYEGDAKNTNEDTNKHNQKVELVTSMLKTENAKRKEANQNMATMMMNNSKKKKKKTKSKKNQPNNNQQQDNNNDSITISVTQPTKTNTSTKATVTAATTTTTTPAATTTTSTTTTTTTTDMTTTTKATNTMVPDIGMLPIKCAISISSSSDSTTNPECPAQHFCKLDLGRCTTTTTTPSSSSSSSSSKTEVLQYYNGTCQPQPTECSRKLNPVCGCDGISYNNECIAHSVGVSVSSMGNCPTTINTGGGDDIILVPNIGTLPTKCTIILDNEKFTSSSSSSSSSSSPTCPEDQFCQLESGSCTTTTTTATITSGTCQLKPMLCTLMYSPVCGCDGRTYGSACAAHAVGMSVAYEGECTTTTDDTTPVVIVPELAPLPPIKCAIDLSSAATTTATTCSPEQFCQLETGACIDSTITTTTAILRGTCQSKPTVCVSIYNPVCGCDGRTYDSMCTAHGAGVSVSYTGECDDTISTTTTILPPTATLLNKEEENDDDDLMRYNMFEGPCTSDTQCAVGLVCHTPSSKCVCNESTNEGCPIAGQLCGINPGLYCGEDGEGCLPTCFCDYTSPFPAIFTNNETDGDATSNGCEVGEVCRMPCAMADTSPTCFRSEIERDCRSGYVCVDGNGDGVINQNDGGSGCIEMTTSTTTTATTTITTTEEPATLATTSGTPPIQEMPCRIAGHCRSPSGVCEPSVACIADPCSTASCAANYVCEANYCGGCHANCVLADS